MTWLDSSSVQRLLYMVLNEESNKVVGLVLLALDQQFLKQVVGQDDHFSCPVVPQLQCTQLAIYSPLLYSFVGLVLQNPQALLCDFLDRLFGTCLHDDYNYMPDYQQLYKQKCRECEQLSEQINQFQEQSNLIINDLEEEVKEIKRKHDAVSRQLAQQKDKNKCFRSSIEREVDRATKERNQFKKKFQQFQRKVIELEIVNENLQSDLRATQATLSEYESRTEKTMEELAMAQIQMEETTQNNKETVARLKGQLKEAEEELFAFQRMRERKESEKVREEVVETQQVSEIAPANTNLFKEALRDIREYISGLDARKSEMRKMLLR